MYGAYIVDDESLMIESVIGTVSWAENGFEVIGSSTNPLLAVDEIISLKPDLVISDLKMPQMDGLTLMKTLRDAGENCEFVMLSAFGEFEASRDFFKMDGFDYLLKPLDPQDAESVLEKLWRKIAKKNNVTPVTSPISTKTTNFDSLVKHISENYGKKVNLKSLSREFNISANYICTLFAKHYNSTLTTFITGIRMREAARMLKETDSPLKEVAILCGYPDYFYFSRTFKAHFGVPPLEYRQAAIAAVSQ